MTRLDALVLDVDARAGLCCARALGRDGLAVGVAARAGAWSGMRTRYAVRRVLLPDPQADFAAHVAALEAALVETPADATIPSIDSSVEALHRNRDRLGRHTAPAVGAPDAVEAALSKERTLAVADALGIPHPRSVAVSRPEDVASAAHEVGLPAVLKPVSSWRDVGAGGERVAPVYLADAEAARRAGDELVRADAPGLVQELAPGPRETIKLFRSGGRWLARVAMLVDRAWPPLGGSSTMRRTVEPPADTLGHAERLVAELGLEGYSEAEFRRGRDGRPLLMEVNPRLSQSVEVAVRAGVPFPRMQLEWARGGHVEAVSRYAVGLRVGWLAGDGRLLAGALLGAGPPPRPALGDTVRAMARDYVAGRARIEGLDRRDVRPLLGALAFAAAGAARRLPLRRG